MGKEVDKVLKTFGMNVVSDAKINVGRSFSTGKLQSSIKFRKTGDSSIGFWMQEYGTFLDQGRDGSNLRRRNPNSLFWEGGNTGRFPPLDAIRKWIQFKGLQISNGMSIESMAFLIGRKIKNFGVRPTMFFTNAWNKHFNKLPDKIVKAYIKDFDEEFDFKVKFKDNFKNIKIY